MEMTRMSTEDEDSVKISEEEFHADSKGNVDEADNSDGQKRLRKTNSLEKMMLSKRRKRTMLAEPELINNTNALLVYGHRRSERILKSKSKEKPSGEAAIMDTKGGQSDKPTTLVHSLALSDEWVKEFAQPVGNAMGLQLSSNQREILDLMGTLNDNLRELAKKALEEEKQAKMKAQGNDDLNE